MEQNPHAECYSKLVVGKKAEGRKTQHLGKGLDVSRQAHGSKFFDDVMKNEVGTPSAQHIAAVYAGHQVLKQAWPAAGVVDSCHFGKADGDWKYYLQNEGPLDKVGSWGGAKANVWSCEVGRQACPIKHLSASSHRIGYIGPWQLLLHALLS